MSCSIENFLSKNDPLTSSRGHNFLTSSPFLDKEEGGFIYSSDTVNNGVGGGGPSYKNDQKPYLKCTMTGLSLHGRPKKICYDILIYI
jgi:hypothetical protein